MRLGTGVGRNGRAVSTSDHAAQVRYKDYSEGGIEKRKEGPERRQEEGNTRTAHAPPHSLPPPPLARLLTAIAKIRAA